MRPVTLLLTGVPHFVTLRDLSYNLDLIFDTDEIGTFKTRDLSTNGKRLIALDFSSGYDAIAAQARLHGYRYELPNGNEYKLCAKITKRTEFTTDVSPSWEIVEESSSRVVDSCKPVGLVPAVNDEDMIRAHAMLDAQLELLKKQKRILKTQREILRERKKLKREYSSEGLAPDDEPTTSRRRLLTPDMSRSPDTMSRERQLLGSHRTPSGSQHKAKLIELRSRSRSKEELTPTIQKKSEETVNLRETLKSKESTPKKAKKSSKQRSRSRNRPSQMKSRSNHSRSRSREVQTRQRSRDRSCPRGCCLPKSATRTARSLRSPERWRWSSSRERLCRLEPARGCEGRRRAPPAGVPSRQLPIMDNCSRRLEAETIIVERNYAMDPVVDSIENVTFGNNFEQQNSFKGAINSFDNDNCKITDIDDMVSKNTDEDMTTNVNVDVPMRQTAGDQNVKQDLRNEDIQHNNVLKSIINLVEELDTPEYVLWLLREIVAGKASMHTKQILKIFREKYPRQQRDELVASIVRAMDAGSDEQTAEHHNGDDVVLVEKKYDTISILDSDERHNGDDVVLVEKAYDTISILDSDERHNGDDVVLVEKKYDTISILDSDDEPELTETKLLEDINSGINSTVPTALQNETLDVNRQKRSPPQPAPRRDKGTVAPGAVAIPPNKARSPHLGEVKAENVGIDTIDLADKPTCEAITLLNSSVKLNETELDDIQEISGSTKSKSETAPHADTNVCVNKTNNTERIKSAATGDEVGMKVKIENNDIVPEFTDVEVENMLSSIANVAGSSAERIAEKETPKVTAITIMTSYSELCSLKCGGNGNGTRKEDEIKLECDEAIEEYKRKSLEEHEIKSPLNTADEVTINSPINKEDDNEESLESISKYVESLCMLNDEHL